MHVDIFLKMTKRILHPRSNTLVKCTYIYVSSFNLKMVFIKLCIQKLMFKLKASF